MPTNSPHGVDLALSKATTTSAPCKTGHALRFIVMRRSRAPLLKCAVLLTLVGGMALVGCGFVHDEHLVGPYYLTAVDSPDDMSVCYELSHGDRLGLIDETVFAVGWNDRFIVAKQHPRKWTTAHTTLLVDEKGVHVHAGHTYDRRVTNYFYLEMARDSALLQPGIADSNWQHRSVTGPLTEAEFQARKAKLGLPDFTRTFRSLE